MASACQDRVVLYRSHLEGNVPMVQQDDHDRQGGHDPQPSTVIFNAATLATIDRWVAYRVWHSHVPGAQVAIGFGNELVFSAAYGYADLERRVPDAS